MVENMVIKELLDQPFCERPLRDKLSRLNKGRPTPPLTNVITHHKTKPEQYTRHFCISQYVKVVWVAGCATANKLYFWASLLFSNEIKVWEGKNRAYTLKTTKPRSPLSTVKIIWKTINCWNASRRPMQKWRHQAQWTNAEEKNNITPVYWCCVFIS